MSDSDLLETRRANRDDDNFRQFLLLREEYVDATILIYEGRQCPLIYQYWLRSFNYASTENSRILIANGKKNALKLHGHIEKYERHSNSNVLYFLDKDFDGYQNHKAMPNIYLTDGYAVENELCKYSSINAFIITYFSVSGKNDYCYLSQLVFDLNNIMNNYLTASWFFHLLIFACKKSDIKCNFGNISLLKRIIKINYDAQLVSMAFDDFNSLLKFLDVSKEDSHLVTISLKDHFEEFNSLTPIKDWRGKFHFEILLALIKNMVEEWNKPIPGSQRKKVALNMSERSFLGALAGCTRIPDSLSEFLTTNKF